MKKLFFLFFLFSNLLSAQVKLFSWNIENLGKSKSDSTIIFIANILKDYDVVALQEVVAGYGGAQAVAKLAEELNRRGGTTPLATPPAAVLIKPSVTLFYGKQQK